jgi:hypothetical protein
MGGTSTMHKKIGLAALFIASAGLSACAVTNNPKLEVNTEPERAGCTITKPILDHIRKKNSETDRSPLDQSLIIEEGQKKKANYNVKPPANCPKPN